MTLGPVQLLVVAFEDDRSLQGQVMAELERLRARDAVRLLDLLVVHRRVDGTLEHLQRTDLELGEAMEVGATIGALIGLGAGDAEVASVGAVLAAAGVEDADGHLLDEDRFWYVDEAIPPGSAAAIVLIEHQWAIGLKEAIQSAGGVPVADEWIHPADLMAVGALAAEDAARQDG